MEVTVEVVNLIEARTVTVVDSFNRRAYATTELFERRTYQAMVNGLPWTPQQTEQAARTSRLCGCRTCACCRIRAAIDRAERATQ